MKICNILSSKNDGYNNDLFLDEYFLNIVTDLKDCDSNLPIILCGLDVVKKYQFEIINVFSNEIIDEPNIFWIKNDKSGTNELNKLLEKITREFFKCHSINIDPIFDNVDLDAFVKSLHKKALIHNGAYEIYVLTEKDNQFTIHSMKKDTLKYLDIDTDEFYYRLIDNVENPIVLSTEEYNLFRCYQRCCDNDITKNEPIFLIDYIQSATGELIIPEFIVSKFKDQILKQDLLIYFYKLYLNITSCFDFKTYDRLIRSAKAEQVLSESKIHVNIPRLSSYSLVNHGNSDIKNYLNNAIENNGFISSKHYSRDKRTFRIFIKKKELNLINLSDKFVLDSLTSRYEDGKIVCMDYSNYEYNILISIMNMQESLPNDFHLFTSNKLNVSRDVAKKINFTMFYGKDSDVERLLNNDFVEWNSEYLELIYKIRHGITELFNNTVEQYRKHGYIVNSYGRKIYPKNEASIINNLIQSIGVEILIDVLIALDLLSRFDNDWNIMFQRFDSVYFDFSPEAIKDKLPRIVEIMTDINDKFNLKINFRMGESVYKLKEI